MDLVIMRSQQGVWAWKTKGVCKLGTVKVIIGLKYLYTTNSMVKVLEAN